MSFELVEAEGEAAAINRLTVLLQQAGFNTAYEAANEQLPSAVPVESAAAAASGARLEPAFEPVGAVLDTLATRLWATPHRSVSRITHAAGVSPTAARAFWTALPCGWPPGLLDGLDYQRLAILRWPTPAGSSPATRRPDHAPPRTSPHRHLPPRR